MSEVQYQIGGSLASDAPTYVVRKADAEIYEALGKGEFCYVLNSRQMGKSSLLVRTLNRLQAEGCRCATLDMTRIGSENITPLQWYKGIVAELWRGFNLLGKVNLKTWWRDAEDVSLLQRLSDFIEDILIVNFPEDRIFIFVDEIDSILSLDFPVDDFFAFIRFCYNRRAVNPSYSRLTFAIFGVATPGDLIADRNRTPFNIGRAIDLQGFSLEEAQPLAKGLSDHIENAEPVLKEILAWTGGQPFLSQKLCQQVLLASQNTIVGPLKIPPGTEGFWVEVVARERIINNWESQDEPEHLRTVRDRICRNFNRAGRLLGICQLLLQGVEVPADDSREHTELLFSGLVVRERGVLKLRNRIYQEVFNLEWVAQQLACLRPYSQALDAWIASKQTDESRLLRGQALKDAQSWAQGKSLSDSDYQFLAASADFDRREVQIIVEAERAKEVEARLAEEKKTAKLQRFLLVAVGAGLLVSTGLGVGTFFQYRQAVASERQARLSEIQALASSSEGRFASSRRLDALVEAIKAKRRLQKLGGADKNTERQVGDALRQAVYGTNEYNRLSGHKAAVMAVDVSPDSSVIASASVDSTVKLWQRDGTGLAALKGHKGIVRAVKFSPDGEIIASGSDDGTVKLWERDGSLLRTLSGHRGGVWAVAFSPDGKTLASAGLDQTVKLWKRDGTLLQTLRGYAAGLSSVAFSPDGQTLASSGADSTVRLWERSGASWEKAEPAGTLEGHTAAVSAVAFSPDGQTLASASADNTVKLWKRQGASWDRAEPAATLEGHGAPVSAVAFSPDGQTVASASRDRTVKLWNADGTELAALRGHSAPLWGVAFSPDGSFIASAGAENTVRLWLSENPLQKTVTAHKGGIWGVDISADGSAIATGSEDGTVKLWNRQGRLQATFRGHTGAIYAVALSGDGKFLASAGADRTVRLWKRDGTLLETFAGHSAAVFAVAFSPDGETIASAGPDSTVKLWQRSGSLLQTLTADSATLWQVAFSPTGNLLASAGGDGTVKLWQRDSTGWHRAKPAGTLEGHSAPVWRVAFSPQGNTLASASGDNTVKLWERDATDGIYRLSRTLEGHSAAVWGVAFSPTGNKDAVASRNAYASGSVDSTVKLWDRDGREITALTGHSAAVRGVAISRDGAFLASVSEDSTLVLWNLQRILNLDVLAYGCERVRDYLRTNSEVGESDRHLCDGI